MEPELAQMQFDVLKKRIGENVSCKAWLMGKELVREGVLTDVRDFDGVTIDGNILPFVGTYQAIEEIHLSNDGRLIYANPRAVGYNIAEETNVMNAQEMMLGRSVLKENMLSKAENQSGKTR